MGTIVYKPQSIQAGAAENPACPPPILEHLSLSSNISVRECVARNPSTPPETLQRLSTDPWYPVSMYAISGLGGTPPPPFTAPAGRSLRRGAGVAAGWFGRGDRSVNDGR